MARLSIDDYLALLRAPLGRTVERAQRVVPQELMSASQTDRYGSSIRWAMDRLQREFDTGVLFALARLKRARQRTSLDHSELWQTTVQELENFTRQMKLVVDHEVAAGLRLSQLTLVNSALAKLDENLSLALRHFQEGLVDDVVPLTPSEEVNAAAGNRSAPLGARSDTQAESPARPDTSTPDVPEARPKNHWPI